MTLPLTLRPGAWKAGDMGEPCKEWGGGREEGEKIPSVEDR